MKTKTIRIKPDNKLYCQEAFPGLLPREQAAIKGVSQLSDLDLVQALLGCGNRGKPVRQLAAEVLAVLDRKPGQPTRDELLELSGMGQAKTTLICSALELARRLYLPERRRIRMPTDVLPTIRHYADRDQELFLCLALNGANEILSSRVISIGLVNRTLVHPREVFAEAITLKSTSIIVAHNHPSGCLEPSGEDKEVTRRLKAAGEILGIVLLDHLIFSQTGYFSFVEDGLI